MQDIAEKKAEKEINKLIRKSNVQKAIEECEKFVLSNPDNARMRIRLGDLYMDWHLDIKQVKQYVDEAITQYQIASESLGDNGEIYYKIGFALYYKGELDKAMNYFNLAITNGANKAQCYYMLANCYKKKDRYADALIETEKALKHAVFNASRIHWLRHRLLRVLYFSDRKTKFQSIAEAILSYLTLPFDPEARKDVRKKISYISVFPELFKAGVYFQMKEIDKAIEIYKQAIEKMPGFTALYCLMGSVYRSIGQQEEAIIEYGMAKLIDPLCTSAYAGLAQAYEEMQDYDSAINTYLKFIAMHPNNAVLHTQVANLYFMKQDAESAISHYQTALVLNNHPQACDVAQTLGYTQQTITKNVEAAVSSFQVASILRPKDIDVYMCLGSAFYDLEDFDNSLVVYRRALELEPENAKIHCNLGYLYWGMENITEAIKEYELSIKYDPEYEITYNNLGVIYLDDLAHIDKAKDCFEKAIELNPNYALAYYNLARTLSIKGEKIEAAKYYQDALNINSITDEIDPQEIQDRLNNLFDWG